MSQLKYLQTISNSFTVLIVEDSIHIQKQMRNFLEKVFEKVLIASNGIEAIEIFKSEKVDIILTDIAMPEMDGFEFSEYVTNLVYKPQIIVISAHAFDENIRKFMKLGIIDILQKPVKYDLLVNSLIKAIDNLKEVESFKLNKLVLIEEKVFAILNEYKTNGIKIKLHNTYKGLIIPIETFILKVTSNTIIVHLPKDKVKLAQMNNVISLIIDNIVLTCSYHFYDKNEEELVLSNCKFFKNSFFDRKSIRVVPDKYFTISVFFNGEKMTFEDVASISTDALAVNCDKLKNFIKEEESLDLVMTFNSKYSTSYDNNIVHKERLSCKADVLRINSKNERYKTVFKLNLLLGDKKILEKYISEREKDILHELKRILET